MSYDISVFFIAVKYLISVYPTLCPIVRVLFYLLYAKFNGIVSFNGIYVISMELVWLGGILKTLLAHLSKCPYVSVNYSKIYFKQVTGSVTEYVLGKIRI